MKPSQINHSQGHLFEQRLSDQLNPKHELIKLAKLINWNKLDHECSVVFSTDSLGGQPPKPSRLMLGLLILEHLHNLSDEEVVERWIENPYWQYFCGFDYLQWKMPIDPSSLTRWRKRLGKELLERLLQESIRLAKDTKTVKNRSLKRVISDTTVMEKNITYPTDGKLYSKGRELLVKRAQKANIPLRQNYNLLAKKHLRKISQYGHAKQYKRMRQEIKKLKNYLGRVYRDIQRKIGGKEEDFRDLFPKVEQLLQQGKESKEKLYSFYHPEVECISKGKAHKKYEFGCKVALVTTHLEGLCLSIEAKHGNPYDGHTLKEMILKAEENSSATIEEIFLDKGYKGAKVEGKEVYRSGIKKGINRRIRKAIKRRQAIEPHIGHMKSDGKLGRNYLKGKLGDQINALLVGTAHNFRMILRKLRIILTQILWWLERVKNSVILIFFLKPKMQTEYKLLLSLRT